MKRAATIIGRFAFGGWVLVTGTIVAPYLILGLVQGKSNFLSNIPWLLLEALFGSFLGIVGGGVVGIIAALLERLLRRPAGKAVPTNEADPSVWPPAPKPPK